MKKNDLLFGVQAVLESLKAEQNLDRILIQRELGKTSRLGEIIALAEERQVPLMRVPAEKLDRLTPKNHQGVVAFRGFVDYASLSDVVAGAFEAGKTPLVLLLDRVTDVRNFGAICRTAEVSGVTAVVIPEKGGAQVNGEAVKTSSGALNFLPVCREANLFQTVKMLQASGLQVVACTEKAEGYFYNIDLALPTAIVMGSEEDGISNDILRICDHLARIPQYGQVQSLNVSVAAGVAMYEAIRQRL
ncbi:MAG: 23S rRNA (guanosine(2251)-2'-O)-methyltransferase RlmB [Bacteroidetes bacterium]|nr:MAG: 23S rRNA (guanosine(2251)-2'-O)-methyltransferase RlmB [Bacteroidota bacterium]